jgi:hypothetical protein
MRQYMPALAHGVYSIEPSHSGSKVDHGEEVPDPGLVIAGGNVPVLLQLGEDVIDQVATF